ncbi:hypothetical protein ACFRKE_00635 [Kitasatospora indigofera]|uniref:hypothetical protein n=1 Tax=Kitasatospora indigofera TaxID=67307 RepID=UPI0036B2BC8E
MIQAGRVGPSLPAIVEPVPQQREDEVVQWADAAGDDQAAVAGVGVVELEGGDLGHLHLLINQQTATGINRASNHWISATMRGQDATLERLRVDRQLEEALVQGPDPLHLAEVFGLHETTAMRYADSARALLEQAAEKSQP